MNTNNTVPGQMVISVLRTNRVLKLMRLRAPILLEEASVKSWERESEYVSKERKREKTMVTIRKIARERLRVKRERERKKTMMTIRKIAKINK